MRFILVYVLLLVSQNTFAASEKFESVWSQVKQNSKTIQAAKLKSASAEEAQDRSARHWFPKVYLDMKSYKTTDPGANFFGVIEQRSLRTSDFDVNQINSKEAQQFSRGTLGLDFPLYEGGMKHSYHKAQKENYYAEENQSHQTRLDQFAQVGNLYASIGILNGQLLKLNELKKKLQGTLQNYKLGSKSNPIGYSGQLGLKSLLNKVEARLSYYEVQKKSAYRQLQEMGFNKENWDPDFSSVINFADTYFKVQNSPSRSFRTESLKNQANMLKEYAEMERARYLPRVGLFAETYQFDGERDRAGGYTAGLYMQWSLLDLASLGAMKEARLKAHSLELVSQDMDQHEKAQKSILDSGIQTARQSVTLLNESFALLVEQVKVTEGLFKNGTINVLQFLEVLGRKEDLIYQQTEAELQFIKMVTQQAALEQSTMGRL